MKQIIMGISLLIFLTGGVFGQKAADILAQADSMFTAESTYSESTMTIIRKGRTLPVQEMVSYAQEIGGRYHSLSVYNSPARMKGTAYLMIEDDLWVRFASTGRVRKLSSSAKKNSAGGSDFSYADMGDGNQGIGEKYIPRLLGDEEALEVPCYKIELTPKGGEEAPYDKLVAYISRDKKHYIQVEHYQGGALIKTMFLTDYRSVGRREYPYQVEMVSHTSDSRTIIESQLVEFGSSRVQRRFFSQSYLESIR